MIYPHYDEPQPVDRAHYEGVIKDVVSKFKASHKGKPGLWFEMQYPTADVEPKQCKITNKRCLHSQQNITQ